MEIAFLNFGAIQGAALEELDEREYSEYLWSQPIAPVYSCGKCFKEKEIPGLDWAERPSDCGTNETPRVLLTEKKPRLFYWEDSQDAWCPVPFKDEEVPGILDVDQLDPGEEIEIRFKRFDMTAAEMATLPEGG